MGFRDEMNNRFFLWTNGVLDILESSENDTINQVVKNQLTRSCTSSCANYRASGRAKSARDMIYKLKIVEEEFDESMFWLELMQFRSNIRVTESLKEANELISIVVSSILKLKSKL